MVRLHYLQHVEFEDPGLILEWARSAGHSVGGTALFRGESLPAVDALDWLVVMGGPMGDGDEGLYPWLGPEKRLIREAIGAGKTVLGICLGAQLIAGVLGAGVRKQPFREIGWFGLRSIMPEASAFFPSEFTAFHWHGDTFDIPGGAVRLCGSEACANQAFSLDGGRVLALQFHLEILEEGVRRLIRHCAGEITPSLAVQAPELLLKGIHHLGACHALMRRLLEVQASGVVQ